MRVIIAMSSANELCTGQPQTPIIVVRRATRQCAHDSSGLSHHQLRADPLAERLGLLDDVLRRQQSGARVLVAAAARAARRCTHWQGTGQ